MARAGLAVLAVISAQLLSAAQAQPVETLPAELGNLTPGFYPAPPCAKPVFEEGKGEMGLLANSGVGSVSQFAVDDRHRRVENFNKAVAAYNGCAKTYIQNSRYDIERILSTVNTAIAQAQGTAPPAPPTAMGNLPAEFYPRSPCVRPDQTTLGAQPAITDVGAMAAYNLKVETFNQQAATFNTCAKTYRDKAQHDIQEIQAAVQPPTAPAQSSRAAVAESPAPGAQSAAPPVESVVVTGASSQVVNRFVEAAVTPTHVIGKVARWDVPICPVAVGVPDDDIALVVKRVKEVAVQAGARVSGNPVCKPNIVIAFTSTPQDLLDSIRKDHAEWLGYHSSSEELNRLGTIARPIQAWYSTATVDLHGLRQIDSARTDSNGRGLLVTAPCVIVGGGTPMPSGAGNIRNPDELCTKVIPNAIGTEVKGSRLTDGLRATFDHVTIIANPPAAGAGMPAITDYIAVLALAQVNSLDTCQALPSITNLLTSGCTQATMAITANDMGYLRAVYDANPAGMPGIHKNEIARRMEQGIAGQ